MDITFPYYINLGLFEVHPHAFFEIIGWVVGISLMVILRKKNDDFTIEQRSTLILAATLGAVLGAKILSWLQHANYTIDALYNDPVLLIGGKTMVGGLLGGLFSVECAKKFLGITKSTGDVYVYPLIVSISIGRIGCFFTGLDDATYGIASNLPWAIDFGDGVSRHPTQLYEILFLILFGLWIHNYSKDNLNIKSGDMFRFFMIAYLTWRLLIDGLKPSEFEVLFLTPIQWACIGGLSYYYWKELVTYAKYCRKYLINSFYNREQI